MARLQAGSRTIETLVRKGGDPRAQARQIAAIHRNLVHETDAHNRQVLGGVPPSETFVDGRKDAPLESVKLDGGVIVTKYESLVEVLEYIDAMLILSSPVLTGAYARSHKLYADGEEVDPDRPGEAKVFTFVSSLPYSRKIEKGQGSAPDEGVYEGAVALARRRFGNVADIRFVFEGVVDGTAQSYAAIALGGRRKGKTASAEARAAYNRHNENRFPAIRVTAR